MILFMFYRRIHRQEYQYQIYLQIEHLFIMYLGHLLYHLNQRDHYYFNFELPVI